MMVLGARDLPNMTLEQFRTQIILSRGALYDLIFRSSGSTLDTKSQGKGQGGSGRQTLLCQFQEAPPALAYGRDVEVVLFDPSVDVDLLC